MNWFSDRIIEKFCYCLKQKNTDNYYIFIWNNTYRSYCIVSIETVFTIMLALAYKFQINNLECMTL